MPHIRRVSKTRGDRFVRIATVLGCVAFIGLAGTYAYFVCWGRISEFRQKAKAGQLIVRAIEQYRAEFGSYPRSLKELVPKYLRTAPEIADWSHGKMIGWDYGVVTNGTASYRLRYYMGRAGVEYEPPTWFSVDEGGREVLFKNE